MIPLFIVVIGSFFNLLGIYFALRANINVWHAYRSGVPVWPWISNSVYRFRSKIKRYRLWPRKRGDKHITIAPESITATISSFNIKLKKRLNFANKDMSEAERFKRLEEAVQGIYKELDEKGKETVKTLDALRNSLNDIRKKVTDESKRLEAFSKEAVTGDVRLQLNGLLLIGFGTFLTLLATIWQLFLY